MTANSTQLPTLFVENSTGKPGIGFPVKINGVTYIMNSNQGANVSLKELIGKTIRDIEVNGSRMSLKAPLRVTRETQLRFQHLMGSPSYKFHDETATDSDNTPLPHLELSLES